MKMKKTLAALIATGLLGSTTTAYAAFVYKNVTTPVETKTIPFRLKKDNKIEDGQISYKFSIKLLATQSGKVSKPFQFHPIDTRKCSISVSSSIERKVCFTTILGDKSCHNQFTKKLPGSVFYVPDKGNIIDYDPCHHFNSKMDHLVSSANSKLSKQIDNIVDKDIKKLQKVWEGSKAEVTYQN